MRLEGGVKRCDFGQIILKFSSDFMVKHWTVKNAARAHELKYHAGKDGHYRLPTTADLLTFCNAHLVQPAKHLFHKDKKGRGIYKRVFYELPSHGEGAVGAP